MPEIKADFEEKSFEGAFNAELARDRGRVFSPGQVEEAVLGYDAAAVPGLAVHQALARVAGLSIPPGVWLTPNWWLRCAARPDPSLRPSRFASLLLQYKRPSLWYGASAPLISAHGMPYYRIGLARTQHRVLVRLDEALLDEALVRYAAPCTHVRTELDQWQIDREVLENCNFVSPRRIGLRHTSWTYRTPGGMGFRNEFREGDEGLEADSVERLLGELTDRPSALGLDEHLSLMLRRLGGDSLDAAVDDAVTSTMAEIGGFEDSVSVETAVRLRLVGLELQQAGVSWWLYGLH